MKSSILLLSFFVVRPVPLAWVTTPPIRFSSSISYCYGGVTVSIYSGTSLVPILLSERLRTLKEYVTGGFLTSITSPTFIILEALTLVPPMETRPFLQASTAIVLLLKILTAHSHLSILTSFIYLLLYGFIVIWIPARQKLLIISAAFFSFSESAASSSLLKLPST